MNIARYKNILYIISIFAIYNLFFANKAMHIDDTFTISMVKAVDNNFFMPGGFFSNPPFIGYYYLPFLKLFGEKEAVFHIFSLPFSLLTIVSMYLLSIRFVKNDHKILSVLFLVSTPAFIITSQSIMLDMPVLAFMLSAIAAFIYGTDKDDNRLLFLSAALTAIAILIKYSGLVLIPVLLMYSLLFSKRRSWLFLVAPLFIVFIWLNFSAVSRVNFIQALLYRISLWSADTILKRSFAGLSFISGTSVVSLFLIPVLLRHKKNILLFLLSLPVGLCPFLFNRIFGEYSYSEKAWLALLFVSSLFIISVAFKTIFKFLRDKSHNSADGLFLAFWFVLLLVFNVLVQFISARFILLLFPPMFLLLLNELDACGINLMVSFRKIVISSLLITFLISTFLAIGDYHFSGVYRDFVNYIKKEFPRDKNIDFCRDCYYPNYCWGYSYYLNKYYPIIKHSPIREDLLIRQYSFLVLPTEQVLPLVTRDACSRSRFVNLQLDKVLIRQVRYNSYVFLHNRKHRTGFYSHDWGMLPFKFCLQKTTLEKFSIYKLVFNYVIGSKP